MSKKLIACGAAFALVVAAVLAGTAWAARYAPKAGGCCYPGSECCYPGSPCCEADCCYEGSPCCDPPQACCFTASPVAAKAGAGCCEPGAECCFPGSPCCGDDCCVEGAACCLAAVTSATASEARSGKEGCCKKADAKKAEAKGCCEKGCCAVAVKADAKEAAPVADVTVIAVEDMDCPSCAKKVTAKLNEVPGVGKVEADTKASKLTVTPKAEAAPSAKAMWEAVEKAGYKPTRLEGSAGKYTALPKE